MKRKNAVVKQEYAVAVEGVGESSKTKSGWDLRKRIWDIILDSPDFCHDSSTPRGSIEHVVKMHDDIFSCHARCMWGGSSCTCRLVLVVG